MEDGDSGSGTLAELRRRIGKLERRPADSGAEPHGRGPAAPWRLSLGPVDGALPHGGLAPDGVHEAAGRRDVDVPAAAAFLAALLRRFERRDGRDAVLFCQSADRFGRFHAPGWRALGLDPGRFVVARPRRGGDVPWILEEGLRGACLAAVVAVAGKMDFTASRRLSLAAREGGTPALVLRLDGIDAASAAATRWRVAALPGGRDPFDADAFGAPRWRLELKRCRGGRPRCCDVEWNHETGDFRMAAAVAHGPAAPDGGGNRAAA